MVKINKIYFLCVLVLLGTAAQCTAQNEKSLPEEERPKQVAAPASAPKPIPKKTVEIKFESDADATLTVDGTYRSALKKDVPAPISFVIGQTYSMKAESVVSDKDFIKWDYTPTMANNRTIEH